MKREVRYNEYGERVYPEYEVCTEKNIGTREEPDWAEDTDNNDIASNYREAVKMAKKRSLKYPDDLVARVYIVCFYQDSISTYNQAYWEYYKNGKKDERIWND